MDNHLRREGSKRLPELRADLEYLGGTHSFEDEVIGGLSLDEMLQLLSSNQQLALRPKLERGLTAEQIGTEIGKSPDAVRQLQHQAIRRLRRVLFVAVTAVLVVLAAVMSDRDVVVDQTPATSGTEQPSDNTVPSPTTSVAPTGQTSEGPASDERSSGSESARLAASLSESSTASVDDPSVADAVPETAAVPETNGVAETTVLPAPETAVPQTTVPLAAVPLTTVPLTTVPVTTPPPAVTAEAGTPGLLAGSFALVNVGSGECVDQPNSQEDGGRVIQWRCAGHTAVNQIFNATAGNGGVLLAFAHSGRCLDESNQSLTQFACHGGDNQLFNWNGLQLQSKASGLCVTVVDDSVLDGATVHTAPCVNSPFQQFRLERYGALLPTG
jgi:hypothetical protein